MPQKSGIPDQVWDDEGGELERPLPTPQAEIDSDPFTP